MPGKHTKGRSKAVQSLRIGLSGEVRAKVSHILNTLLADVFVAYAQARAFHWNVTGRNFSQDHAFFEEEYIFFGEEMDSVAERARSLGAKVPARLADYLKATRLQEIDATSMTATAMLEGMRMMHESLVVFLREDLAKVVALGDEGTADFLTGLMADHEKRAWLARSHLDA